VRLALARRWSVGMMLWDIEMGDADQREQAALRLQELMLRVVNQPVRARNAPAVEIPPEHRLDAVQSVVLKVLERLQAGRLPVLGQEDARCLQYLKRMIISFEIQRSTRARREVLVSPVREDARASARTAERAHDGSSGGSYRAIQETLETRAMWSSDQPSGWNERLLGLAHSVLSTAVDELVRSRRHSPRTRERFRDTWKELEGLCFGHLLAQSALKSDRCRPRARETAAAWRTRRNRIHKRRERLRDELVGTLDRLEKRRELPPRVAQFGRRAVLELLNQRQSLSDYESIGK
jgi:hypothetical protein